MMGPRVGMRREPCAVCGMPVFLAEKLMISRTPYHRTCFRCARCNNQLTPGNYYETEEGQYCCETCPDEEETKSPGNQAYNDASMLGHEYVSQQENSLTSGYQRSLSDEEKTERKAQLTEEMLDRVAHNPESLISKEKKALAAENISQTAHMRLNFMTNHMLSENLQEDSEKSASNDEEYSSGAEGAEEARSASSSPPGDSFKDSRSPKGPLTEGNGGEGCVDAAIMPTQVTKDRSSISHEPNSVDISRSSSSIVCKRRNETDNLDDRLDDVDVNETAKTFDNATREATEYNNRYSYLDDKDASVRQDTKDTLGLNIDRDANERQEEIVNTSQCLSLVQRRLKMFENSETKLEDKRKGETKMDSPVSKNVAGGSLIDEKLITNEIYEETKRMEDNELGQPKSSFENEEIDSSTRTKEDQSENSENLISSDKVERQLPPIVPKRVALEARRAAKSRAKNDGVTVLNAPGIDLSAEEIYPEDLNPFKSDEEEDLATVGRNFENSRSSKVSTNPFGSSDEEEEETVKLVAPPRPATRSNVAGKKSPEEMNEEIDQTPTKRKLKAPQIHLNPFWSDDDEDQDSDDECGVHSLPSDTPVPKPRTINQTSQRKADIDRCDIYASNSSLGSTGSASTPGGSYRKKKPAPPPPIAKELFASGADSLLAPNRRPYTGSNNSLHTTPRSRKAKPAPPPPMSTSTPCSTNLSPTESSITDTGKILESEDYKTWDDPKIGKDEANRNKQSMTTLSCNETNLYGGYTDKSVQGKWKRKKGPAPARPIPHRRKIKVMSLKDVKLELDEIEMQQQGLEKQGVRLEQLIRDKAETGNAAEEKSLGMDVEELVLELFALVNEKNELFRRQAELMLLRRQQRLEEEHADIEYQIRCLLCQPEATKTDFDKQREEILIQRLVEIVERRNEIVECLEMDRRREVEEDRSINTRMGLYAAKNKADFAKELENDENKRSRKSKKTKLKEKAKEKILRKGHKKDADKDVDETEVKLKHQNKRKWF